MAAVARKALGAALDAALRASYPFKGGGRRLRDPKNVLADERPALFTLKRDEQFERHSGHNLPPIVEVPYWAVVYTDFTGIDPANPTAAPDPNAGNLIPEDTENDILDALVAALTPGPTDDGRVTLGLAGVLNIIIDGTVERDWEVDLTGKGIMVVPIKVIFTA
jgi:hypothetical protein